MAARFGFPSSVVLAWVAASAAVADAQDSRNSPPSAPRVEVIRSRESGGVEASIAVQGRFSLIGGTVDPDIPSHYNDLFKSGAGVSVEGSLLWPLGPKWRVGPCLSVGWDGFDGKSDTDSVGDTLTPDRLEMTTFLVEFRGVYDLGHHFTWDSRLGFGAAHYSAVSGVFSSGGILTDVTVFKSSTAFAFDFGTRFVYDAGPVFFDLGVGFRSQGAPGNADFNFNSGPVLTFGVEFGAGIRF